MGENNKKELSILYGKANIMGVVKVQRLRWMRHMERMAKNAKNDNGKSSSGKREKEDGQWEDGGQKWKSTLTRKLNSSKYLLKISSHETEGIETFDTKAILHRNPKILQKLGDPLQPKD